MAQASERWNEQVSFAHENMSSGGCCSCSKGDGSQMFTQNVMADVQKWMDEKKTWMTTEGVNGGRGGEWTEELRLGPLGGRGPGRGPANQPEPATCH